MLKDDTKTPEQRASRRAAVRRGTSSVVEGLRAFLRLPVATQALALEAAFALLLAKLLVECIPMRFWRRRLDTVAESAPVPLRAPRRVGRIVRKVARRLPLCARCLPQAMAAQWMLRRRGIRSRLVFGVRRGPAPAASLEFHAWLIVAGECVIGAREVETFRVLAPPEAQAGCGG